MSSEKTECSICVETFNKSTRKPVVCLNCDGVCCRECHQTYLFSRDTIDCMFCQEVQSFEHIKNSHYSSFIQSTGNWKNKGFREHEEEVFFKNEMSMFPETLERINLDKEFNKLNNKLKELNNDRKKLCLKLEDYNKEFEKKIIYVKSFEVEDAFRLRDEKVYLYKEQIRHLREEIVYFTDKINNLYHPNSKSNKVKVNVLNKCMSNDCDGYLNSKWSCQKCGETTCKKCREIVKEDHQCDPEIVKTIKLAISTSKPCPKCSERIHRIYGCDQVYCPICKIVFSYSTGVQQIGGIIHQPDAVKELRKNGRLHRDVRDIPCGGVDYILHSDKNIFPFYKFNKLKKLILAIVRWAVGYEQGQLYDRRAGNINELNYYDRYSYLEGKMTKEEFKRKIYISYKRYEKNQEDRKIIAGLYICVADMLRSLEGMNDYNTIYEHLCQMFILFENYNDEFMRNYKIYNKLSPKTVMVHQYMGERRFDIYMIVGAHYTHSNYRILDSITFKNDYKEE